MLFLQSRVFVRFVGFLFRGDPPKYDPVCLCFRKNEILTQECFDKQHNCPTLFEGGKYRNELPPMISSEK